MLVPRATCDSVTTVLTGKATLQTPDVVPSLIVQLMPAGMLVTVPPPRDAGEGATCSVVGMAAGANPAPTVAVAAETIVALHVVPAHAPV